jgi:hypothetical protein
MTESGRDLAKVDGWYEDRRAVQMALIKLLAGVGLFGQNPPPPAAA